MNNAEIAHGPMFIGVVFNLVLYGIMITQTFLYFTTYNDRNWMKLFIIVLFISDTANSIFDLVYLYDSLVIHFDSPTFLTRANWVFATDPAMTGIIGGFVQYFFAWRVKVLTGNRLLVFVIIALATASVLCSIATSIAVGIVPEYVQFQKFKSVVIIWLGCASLADVIITSSLVFHLQKHKTGFSTTDHVINRINRITVQTGLITSICATIDLIVFLAQPSGLHLIFNMPLSKLYTNSLMSSLNSRGGWKFNQSEVTHDPKSVSGSGHTSSSRRARFSTDLLQIGGRPEVMVHVEQHEMSDRANEKLRDKAIFDDQTPEKDNWDIKRVSSSNIV